VTVTDWLPDGKLPDASTKDGAFLFLVGVILNQNISGELAWRGVARLSDRTDLRPQNLLGISVCAFEPLFTHPPAVHPFAATMARAVLEAAERVCNEYRGDTRLLWRGAADSQDVANRLRRFRQIGSHKSDVAVFLLVSVYQELSTSPSPTVPHACPSLISYLGRQN
jgi:hypothetical protein